MLKKFLIGTFVAVALMAASVASAAYDFGPTTLKVGSKGDYVKTLQTFVGATADGSFGPMTAAKVKAWQASNGLTADGMFGNLSKAKANDAQSNFPAGCVSATGYSSLTGASCATVVPVVGTLPAGCTTTAGFSPTTGASCAVVSTLPAGCSTTAGYSSTTGVSCGTAVVTGGVGDIKNIQVLSSVSNVKVGEGESSKKVFAYEVEADNGSDINMTSVKLNLQNGGTASKKLDRYATNVSVWMGSTKVGSASVADFSESSDVYSKSISLSGAIVPAGKKVTMYVTVDSLSKIDSTYIASSAANTWTVTLENTRFVDGTGAIMTDTTGSISKTFYFASLSASSDVELKVNLATGNKKATTVKVSTTNDTPEVELLRFTMKAQGTKMYIDQIPVTLAATTATDLDQVTSNVVLKIAGNTYNESVITTGASTVILFNDLNLSVAADDTIEGVVYADVNNIEAGYFDQGSTLTASIPSSTVTLISGSYINVEDANGDQLATGDRTGSAIGEAMTFRSTGVNTVLGTVTTSQTTDQSGNITSVTYTIPLAVTSFGNTLYVGQAAELASTVSATQAFAYVFENSTAPSTPVTSGTVSTTLASSDAVIETNGFRLDDGVTKNFVMTVNFIDTATAGSYRVALKQIKTFTDAALTTGGSASALAPVESFRTGYKLINS